MGKHQVEGTATHIPSRGKKWIKVHPEGHALRRGNYPNLISYDFGIIKKKKKRKKRGGRKSPFYPQSPGLCKLQSPNLAKFRKLAGQRPWGSFLSQLKKKMVRVLLTELLDVSERGCLPLLCLFAPLWAVLHYLPYLSAPSSRKQLGLTTPLPY